ncbi:MAG TPA: thiamine pyrophosphate-dependent dehydrogenase E1 component subunit alpha [Herpetosiphonaceae bacterium]
MTNVQPSGVSASLERDDLLAIYELMLLSRLLDERQWILNRQGKAPFVISCQGHEAAQVGSAYALKPGKDWVLPYYRDLGVVLTLGFTPTEVMMGLFARVGDPNSAGRQMPAHYGHRKLNIISQSSPTGTQVPHAAGVGLAIKIRNEVAGKIVDDAVAWVSFGEGTSSQGEIHEAMNLAGTHKLPVIFVCENNGYAISVPQRQQMGVEDVADRAAGYGFPGVVVDGSDPVACFEATQAAVERARRGDGPTLIEFKCLRLTPHSSDDNDRTYRSPDEIKAMKQHDPVIMFEAHLKAEEILTDEKEAEIRARIKQQVNEATAAAEAAAHPDPSTLFDHIYADNLKR